MGVGEDEDYGDVSSVGASPKQSMRGTAHLEKKSCCVERCQPLVRLSKQADTALLRRDLLIDPTAT